MARETKNIDLLARAEQCQAQFKMGLDKVYGTTLTTLGLGDLKENLRLNPSTITTHGFS
jgi:hypothetical protein